jgi:hypothetical protein
MSKLNLIFYRMNKDEGVVSELSNYYSNNDEYTVEFISTEAQANQFLPVAKNGIFIFEVKTKIDLQAAVNVLKNQKKLIQAGLLKPSCVLHINNKKVEKILAKYGCIDLLDPDIKSKTFSFKIDFWSRALKTLLKKQEKETDYKNKTKQKNVPNAMMSKKKEDFLFVKSLSLQSDIWLVKSKVDCKKILRRWLFRILGPSPHVGKWSELESQPGDKLPTWKFNFHKENNEFILEDGAWYFYGSKPEFDWKLKRWNFSSDAPHLYFHTSDKKTFSRFKFIDGIMEVAENSQFAQTKEELILETCDSNFSFVGDEAQNEESNSFDGEADELNGNMIGDVKDSSDNIDGHLTGKLDTSLNEEEEERKSSGAYSEDDIPGHMGGKSSTDQINDGPMSGKSSTDNLDGSPMSGSIKPAAEKNKEDKKSSFKEDEIPGHLGGKGSTDNLDGSPMSGSIKPGTEKNKEDKKSSFKEDEIPGHLGGKSSTDEIDGSPMSGSIKPGAEKNNKAQEDSENEPFIPTHQLTQEEFDNLSQEEIDALSRDGIGIIAKDKNGNPILNENGEPVLKEVLGKKKKQNLNPNADDGLIKEKSFNPAHQLSQEEFDNLSKAEVDEMSRDGIGIIAKDKNGKPLLNKEGRPVLKNPIESKVKDTLAKGTTSSIKSPFGKKPISKSVNSSSDKEAHMEEALGGGIADMLRARAKENEKLDLNKQIGSLIEEEVTEELNLETEIGTLSEKKDFDLNKIIDGQPQVNVESGEVKVILKQETKAGNDITFICDFEDFYTDELIVHAPKESLPLDSQVKGKVSLKYGNKKINVIIEGKISEIDEFDDRKDTLVIEVSKIDEGSYEEFISLYQDRQENIMDFMQKAKGY